MVEPIRGMYIIPEARKDMQIKSNELVARTKQVNKEAEQQRESKIMEIKNPDISKKESISLIRACVAWILTACIFSTLFVMCNLLYNMA